MEYFNFKKIADEAGIPPEKLAQLCAVFEADYPLDKNLQELHILRACMAIRDGNVTLDQILEPEAVLQAL